MTEEPQKETPEEVVEEISEFSLEEIEAMKTLAEMGRLYDDEDEAKMTQLTEDLTKWINKYASTFDDPEHLLFEVTSSLIPDEMTTAEDVQVEEP